jgi:hypothetical protein
VPKLLPEVITRDDPAGRLLFQVRTDEIFIVDLPTFAVLQLCDGAQTIVEIAGIVAAAKGTATSDTLPFLDRLLTEMRRRELIEIWDEA